MIIKKVHFESLISACTCDDRSGLSLCILIEPRLAALRPFVALNLEDTLLGEPHTVLATRACSCRLEPLMPNFLL